MLAARPGDTVGIGEDEQAARGERPAFVWKARLLRQPLRHLPRGLRAGGPIGAEARQALLQVDGIAAQAALHQQHR